MSTTTPTQVKRPWRATARTAFAVVIALAAMLPLLVDAAGLDETLPPIAAALAIASAITRIMALPAVEDFLQRFLPFLAAEPDPAVGDGVAVSKGDVYDDLGVDPDRGESMLDLVVWIDLALVALFAAIGVYFLFAA